MRLVSYGIPVKTDVSHLGGGHESQDTVHHPKAGPQDGNHGHLFAGDHGGHAGFNGGLHRDVFQGEVAKGFVSHKHGYFFD